MKSGCRPVNGRQAGKETAMSEKETCSKCSSKDDLKACYSCAKKVCKDHRKFVSAHYYCTDCAPDN